MGINTWDYEAEEDCLNAKGLKIEKCKGKDTFGVVYKVIDKSNGTLLAATLFSDENLKMNYNRIEWN